MAIIKKTVDSKRTSTVFSVYFRITSPISKCNRSLTVICDDVISDVSSRSSPSASHVLHRPFSTNHNVVLAIFLCKFSGGQKHAEAGRSGTSRLKTTTLLIERPPRRTTSVFRVWPILMLRTPRVVYLEQSFRSAIAYLLRCI